MAKKQTEEVRHKCGECAHCTYVKDHWTLSVDGKRPTLGRCPFWKKSRSVLLSQKACGNFKMRME